MKLFLLALVAAVPGRVPAAEAAPAALSLPRISSPIRVDGDLSDAGWTEAAAVDIAYEISPGDNVTPPVRTTARIGYDDRFFYASFRCEDPDIRRLRAPFVDRDGISDDQDYVGILLDVENRHRAAIDFWIGPRGIQADSVFNEGTFNEDFAPDYFWQSAARIGSDGWTVEVAIPLSSLRYTDADPQNWAVILYRVYPREFNYQLYSVPVPRGASCFLCQSATITNITGLPKSTHLVAAPYAAGSSETTYPGAPGYYGDGRVAKGKVGADVKWLPSASTVVDGTVNPDFSQIESDVAQIAVNERFALFYPEKRPFFLEHVDLFQMPIQAVYTRTVTSPLWGARLTGRLADSGTSYTALATQDRGGGTVVLPGPVFSDAAPQDFGSFVGIGRVRQDLGASFVGLVATGRAVDGADGGGHNAVVGGDFQWRPNAADVVTGQYLYAFTQNPDRPELHPDFDGRRFSGFGWTASWTHSTERWQWQLAHLDFATGFRADDGFVPQVGYRDEQGSLSYRFYPTGFFSRVRPLVAFDEATERGGELVSRRAAPGVAFAARWGIRGEVDYSIEAVRIAGRDLPYDRVVWTLTASPSRIVPSVAFSGNAGEQPDVSNARVGTGATMTVATLVRPFEHLALDANLERQWLDETVAGRQGRLFTASVARVKATYVFDARMLVRLIGQYVETRRDPSLWIEPVAAREGAFTGSALFSYKLDWQTVLFAGYGDDRALDDSGRLRRSGRQFFLKVSYAFQR